MRETFAGELLGKTLVVERVVTERDPTINMLPPMGWQTVLRIKETGQPIENVTELAVFFEPNNVVTAHLTLTHVSSRRHAEILEEKVIMENPELRVNAVIVKEVHTLKEEPE